MINSQTFIHTEPGTTSYINKCQNAGIRKHVYRSEQVFGLIRNTTDKQLKTKTHEHVEASYKDAVDTSLTTLCIHFLYFCCWRDSDKDTKSGNERWHG